MKWAAHTAVKGCESSRHQRRHWDWVGGVGQLCSPISGEAGIRCISLEARELQWNTKQSHQDRVQPSTGGAGGAICPTMGNCGLCEGVLRAQKAASAPSHTLELVPGLRTPVFLCLSWLHRWGAEPGQVGSALHAGQF